jgi:hypothetical protein
MCAHRPGNKLLFHCKGSFVTFKIASGKKIAREKAEAAIRNYKKMLILPYSTHNKNIIFSKCPSVFF